MNLLSLYYFVVLSKELHITNTAQKLYISQQNLSQHIQRLEKYYGVMLFYRKPKLALTYAGEQLFQAALKILDEESELIGRLSNISTNKTGHLKIGIPAYRGQFCLPEILPRFYEKWPQVTIQFMDKTSENMEEMVCNGELDFYIGVKHPVDSLLEITPLLNDRIFLVCSDILLERYYPDTFTEIKKHAVNGAELGCFSKFPFLLPESKMRLRKIIDDCFHTSRISPYIFLESSSTELLISLYSNHYGAFFCTQMRLPELIKNAPDVNTFPVLLNGTFIEHPISLVRHRERFLPLYATDFIEITKNVFRNISNVRVEC